MHFLLILIILSGILPLTAYKLRNASHPDHPDKCYIRDDLIMSFSERLPNPDECTLLECLRGSQLFTISCSGQFPFFVQPTELPQCKYDDFVDSQGRYPRCCVRKLICSRPKEEPTKLSYFTRMLRAIERDYEQLLQITEGPRRL